MKNENQIEDIKEYDFDTMEIIKEGFARIEGIKTPFIVAFAIYVVAAIVVSMLLGLIFPSSTVEAPNILNQQIVSILSYPVLTPIMAGIMMMAISHSRGEALDAKSVLNYFHLAGKLALAAVLVYILSVIGFVLLIVPGMYLSVAYAFTLPLIVDKNMDVWAAMEHSRKTVTKHWFKVAGVMGLLTIIMILGAIPLGIGLIWTVPLMFVTLYGLLYPLMFDDN